MKFVPGLSVTLLCAVYIYDGLFILLILNVDIKSRCLFFIYRKCKGEISNIWKTSQEEWRRVHGC